MTPPPELTSEQIRGFEIAAKVLGCLDSSDATDILIAIDDVLSAEVVARDAIKLEAIRTLVDTYQKHRD